MLNFFVVNQLVDTKEHIKEEFRQKFLTVVEVWTINTLCISNCRQHCTRLKAFFMGAQRGCPMGVSNGGVQWGCPMGMDMGMGMDGSTFS